MSASSFLNVFLDDNLFNYMLGDGTVPSTGVICEVDMPGVLLTLRALSHALQARVAAVLQRRAHHISVEVRSGLRLRRDEVWYLVQERLEVGELEDRVEEHFEEHVAKLETDLTVAVAYLEHAYEWLVQMHVPMSAHIKVVDLVGTVMPPTQRIAFVLTYEALVRRRCSDGAEGATQEPANRQCPLYNVLRWWEEVGERVGSGSVH